MPTFSLTVTVFLATCLIVLIITFMRLAVRHTQPYQRIVFVSGPSNMKVLGPGWVMANPFRGRLVLINLAEQNCELFVDEKATIRMDVSYRIIDIEKAVDVGIRQGQMLLKRTRMSEKDKAKILQRGDIFDQVMSNIQTHISVLAIFAFKEASKEYGDDLMAFQSRSMNIARQNYKRRFQIRALRSLMSRPCLLYK